MGSGAAVVLEGTVGLGAAVSSSVGLGLEDEVEDDGGDEPPDPGGVAAPTSSCSPSKGSVSRPHSLAAAEMVVP